MKKLNTDFVRITIILLISTTTQSQDLDSLRRVIRSMRFQTPVLSPIPAWVEKITDASISLNGTWKFNPDQCDIQNASDIEVPGEWEMQGFKVAKGTFATYRKEFSIPPDWKGNRIKIRFDGISSYGEIKINGITVGSHEGSFVAFEFDITGVVKPGDNLLEVRVACETISDKLACTSQYAAHPVGGILRKVTLFALPSIHISDFSWHVEFDDDYRHASLHLLSKVAFNEVAAEKVELRVAIEDENGTSLILNKNVIDVPLNRTLSEVNSIIVVESPEKWDPEHPRLYLLKTSLVVDGKVLQTNKQKMGFRDIELRGNQLFVNNLPIKLRGVNRHEVHPLRGRSLTPGLCRKDVELFREANCNFIRTSHYPPSEEFLQACDELGMFVESEASLCWIEHHASPIWKKWDYLDTKYLPFMVRANLDNVLSGRKHTCIILWSLGNESRWSPLWERVLSEVKGLDPSRPVLFHDQCWGNFNNAGSRADIANHHYAGFDGPRECEKEKSRPTLFGEYMHVQCYARREVETDPSVRSDSYANTLKQMVDSVYKYPACLGGAIWSGVDDIFHLSGERICGYGPWGPIDGWRRRKPEYIGMKKSYAPVIITNLHSAKVVNHKIRLDIENRYNFTNTNELEFIVRSGDREFPVRADIAPLRRGSVIVDLSGAPKTGNLRLTITDPRGFICQEEVIETGPASVPAFSGDKVEVVLTENSNTCMIQSGKTNYTINKTDGSLECIAPGGEKVITDGGILMLVPFNNDNGGAPGIANNNYTQDIRPLEYKPFETVKITSIFPQNRPDGTVKVILNITVENQLEGTHEYLFNTDGTVAIRYDYVTLTDYSRGNLLRQYGLLFTLPGSFDRLSWERKGLWTVYPGDDINRLKGSARALPRDLKYVEAPREVPSGKWKDSANKLGTNDFRSTKDHILWASLKNDKNREILVRSDGSQSVRSWVDGDKIRFLVAGMNGPGSCGFFTGPRPQFKKGDHLTGALTLFAARREEPSAR